MTQYKVQSNSEVYSSFASIYINPVINKGFMGSVVWCRVGFDGQNYFTKID